VLGGIDYNDERKLGDAKPRHHSAAGPALRARSTCATPNLSEPDMLGRAYEYLIEKFADDAGKKGGEFYTPKKVVRLHRRAARAAEGMRICDPTCGSGGMLIECAQLPRASAAEPQEPLALRPGEEPRHLGDLQDEHAPARHARRTGSRRETRIRDPKLREAGGLMLFDRVIANPPFSLDEWGREVAEHDPYGRFRFGIPPKTKGDLAFVQHMVATLNKTGMVGVVMPHGVLFRGASEGAIRKGMLEEDLVEAVIGLPSNLFYGTGIPAAVLLLRRGKPTERQGKVLFVEASREFGPGTNQNFLRREDVTKIVTAVRAYGDVDKYARVVPIEEIAKNEFNLNISRYVETAEAQEKVDVADAVRKLREAERARDEAKAVMDGYLKELGYGGA
jgi:type I restriction enzyme M protein